MAWMTIEEIRRMTRATHKRKMCLVLAEMGVPFKVDGEGYPVVMQEVADRVVGAAVARGPVDIDARLQRLKGDANGKKASKRSRAPA